MMPLFLFLLALASPAGTEQDSASDVKALLLNVRKNVMKTIERLPRYLCTETIDRVTFRADFTLNSRTCEDLAARGNDTDSTLHKHTSDRLRLDVAVSGNEEMYSWAGDDHFDNRSLSDLVRGGATSTGAFASLLGFIFGTDAATFTYNGDVNVNGRPLVEFGFRVPVEKSRHFVGTKQHRAIVGYDGLIWVDPKTSDLTRLTVHSDHLPKETAACESRSTIEYTNIRLNNSDFFIPKEVQWHVVNLDGSGLHNNTVFSACREFLGESTLRFDDAPVESAQLATSQEPAAGLPPNLPFSLALTIPIDTATAATGDRFQAKLLTAIKARLNRVIVPEGAPVSGRIVQIERRYEPAAESLILALKLETIEVNGRLRPFHATLAAVIKKRQDFGSLEQMSDAEDSTAAIFRFENVPANFVINPGLKIVGKTAASR